MLLLEIRVKLALKWDKKVELRKKTISKIKNKGPPVRYKAAPRKKAVRAAEKVNDFRRYAKVAPAKDKQR